ncbi:hypothetical protein TNCV_4616781 [Trichonephila clavipes]|nr:hypothetical protein TNCV_4616781 [Trichonephila clavipes]
MPGKLPSPKIFDPTAKIMPVFVWYTTRYPRVRRGIPALLREGQVQSSGLMVVKGVEQQNFFQELELYAMALENLPKFKHICDVTVPTSVHEGLHEEEDILYCTMLKSYQFAKYLQQFNKLHDEWSYKVTPVTIKFSNASIPEDGKDPEVICLTVDHSNFLTTAKDSRANRYINELSLKSHLPRSVPLEYLSFCVRGKFCHLAQGNRGLTVVKGSDQRKFFEKLGLFTINLEILPHIQDLNDCTLPDHLHDKVHEDYDFSECTMEKCYRFARYLQHFNKLQAECKRQTAHLGESITTPRLECIKYRLDLPAVVFTHPDWRACLVELAYPLFSQQDSRACLVELAGFLFSHQDKYISLDMTRISFDPFKMSKFHLWMTPV